MADDPQPWMDILRDKGVAAGVGAAVAAAGLMIKNRVGVARLEERIDEATRRLNDTDRRNQMIEDRQHTMAADLAEMKGDIKVILSRLDK